MSESQKQAGMAIVERFIHDGLHSAGIAVHSAEWKRTAAGFTGGFELFVVFANDKQFNERFKEEHLEDAPATPEVQALLRRQSSEFVMRIRHGDNSQAYRATT